MRRRAFLGGAIGLGVLGCATTRTDAAGSLAELRERYFRATLMRHPVTSTYLGGSGYAPELRAANRRLRDYSVDALTDEIAWLQESARAIGSAGARDASERIDQRVMLAQIEFVRHMLADRRYQERAVDTYTVEAFHGVDWQLQQMTPVGNGFGSDAEWDDVVARVGAVPAFLANAEHQLRAGIAANNRPDHRIVHESRDACADNAKYFGVELLELARAHTAGRALADNVMIALAPGCERAAAAFTAFADFLARAYADDTVDRYATGEDEYAWRLRNCLLDTRSPGDLFEYGRAEVAKEQARMFALAEEIATNAKLALPFGTDADKRASLRAVLTHLEHDNPKSDAELFHEYRTCIERTVAYGRTHAMFDIPASYRLDLMRTPPVLASDGGGGAQYFPKPPFLPHGTGRFYLDPTNDDPVLLAATARASVADTAIHEGFPGHDWHYQFMNAHAREIANVRWLTAGSADDSFSMWSDSMAAEGWALYAEELMAEPVPGSAHGFYTPAEALFAVQGQLMRAVRVVVDVGIHTKRMTFDQGVDYNSAELAFAPAARAASDDAGKAIHTMSIDHMERYASIPTQAITYNLGKTAIIDLRERERAKKGAQYSARDFHERFMKMGTIPAAYFRDDF